MIQSSSKSHTRHFAFCHRRKSKTVYITIDRSKEKASPGTRPHGPRRTKTSKKDRKTK